MIAQKDMPAAGGEHSRLGATALLILAPRHFCCLPAANRMKPKLKRSRAACKLMTVASGKEVFNRSLPGIVRAAQRVDLAFRLKGR